MTEARIDGVLADFDRRNNAAISAAELRFDPSGWARSHVGGVLAGSRFDTRLQRIRDEKGDGRGRRNDALRLYAPTAPGYPLTFVATTQNVDGNDEDVEVDVFSQACVTCDWMLAVAGSVPREKQPPALPPGRASVPSEEQLASARAVQSDIGRYVRSGQVGVIVPGARLKRLRAVLAKAESFERTEVEAKPYPDDPLHVARVRGGAMAVVQHSFQQTSVAKFEDGYLYWNDKAFAEAIGQRGDRALLSQSGVLTSVVLLPEDDKPVLLGASWVFTGP